MSDLRSNQSTVAAMVPRFCFSPHLRLLLLLLDLLLAVKRPCCCSATNTTAALATRTIRFSTRGEAHGEKVQNKGTPTIPVHTHAQNTRLWAKPNAKRNALYLLRACVRGEEEERGELKKDSFISAQGESKQQAFQLLPLLFFFFL
jgi:hypothetical protein